MRNGNRKAVEAVTMLLLAILLVTAAGGLCGLVVAWIKDPEAVERMMR